MSMTWFQSCIVAFLFVTAFWMGVIAVSVRGIPQAINHASAACQVAP